MTPTPSEDTSAEISSSNRDTWLDNVKLLAIVLVVVGHFIGPMRSTSTSATAISNFIYLFHIPLFVIVAGWFAGRIRAGSAGLESIFWRVLVPYVIFEAINTLVHAEMNQVPFRISLDQPSFGMWFLLSLAMWRFIAPWTTPSRYAVQIAVTVALIAGYVDSFAGSLSLSRTFFFLPAFLLGSHYSARLTTWLRKPYVRRTSSVIVASAAIFSWLTRDSLNRIWLLGSAPYSVSDSNLFLAPLVRLGVISVGIFVALAVASLVPRGESRLSSLGKYTMYAYLLHLPLLRIAKNLDLFPTDASFITVALASLFAIVLTLSLLSQPVRTITAWLVEPQKLEKLAVKGLKKAA